MCIVFDFGLQLQIYALFPKYDTEMRKNAKKNWKLVTNKRAKNQINLIFPSGSNIWQMLNF